MLNKIKQTYNTKRTSHKVVFQLSGADSILHEGLIKQLKNLLTAMDNVEIELVTHGPGIDFLKRDSSLSSEINNLATSGIKLLVCNNTLKERKMKQSDLAPEAEIIPAAVAHLIERQAENWAYIKMGF